MLYSRTQAARATRSQFPFSTTSQSRASYRRAGSAALLWDNSGREGLWRRRCWTRRTFDLTPEAISTEPPSPVACNSQDLSVGFLFEPLYCFFAPFALHRGRPLLLHSPEQFAAANLGGTASSTDARQPPGKQELFCLHPGTQVLEVAETETSSK